MCYTPTLHIVLKMDNVSSPFSQNLFQNGVCSWNVDNAHTVLMSFPSRRRCTLTGKCATMCTSLMHISVSDRPLWTQGIAVTRFALFKQLHEWLAKFGFHV